MTKYPRELRRAGRMVIEQCGEYEIECAAIRSIAAKLGIATAESLLTWVRQARSTLGSGPAPPARSRLSC